MTNHINEPFAHQDCPGGEHVCPYAKPARKSKTIRPDIRFDSYGTVVRIVGLTRAGRNWIDENVQAEGWNRIGDSIISDHRPARAIYDGAFNDGLAVGGVL